MGCKSFSIFIGAVFLGSLALAAEYRPFEYQDPANNLRAEISPLLPKFVTPLPEGIEFSQVLVDGARLNLFKEISEILQAVSGPAQAPASFGADHRCDVHEQFSPPSIAANSQCADLKEIVDDAFARNKKVCLYATQAERFVEDQPPGEFNFWQMMTLEGQIKTAGEPLSHIVFPGNVVSAKLMQSLRTIIAKVRHDQLVSDLDQQREKYQDVLETIRRSPTCVSDNAANLEPALVALENELLAAKDDLEKLDQDGRRQAEIDRNKVLQKGRFRAPLPYPSLTDAERQLLSLYLGGAFWRFRGGGLIGGHGTQAARIDFNLLPMSVIGYLNGNSAGRAAGEAIFLHIFKGWSGNMDMGHLPGHDDKYVSLAKMTDRGLYQIELALPNLQLAGYDTTALKIGGMHMGVCYYFAWDQLANFRIGINMPKPYRDFIDGATAWGELCAGASISLGLSKTMLGGVAGDPYASTSTHL